MDAVLQFPVATDMNNVLFNYLTSFVIGNYIFAQIPPGEFRVRISHLHNTTREDLTSQEVGFVRDATLCVTPR